MRPTIELELIDDPSIFPLSGDKGVPNHGPTIWFKTQPDWYENANYKCSAIYMGGDQPVVYDLDELDEEPLPFDGLLYQILDMRDPEWNNPDYSITHKSVSCALPPLTEKQVADDIAVILYGTFGEHLEDGRVTEDDIASILTLIKQG